MDLREELLASIFRDAHGRRDHSEPARRALRELTATRNAFDRLEATLVREARFAGGTWAEIAADLGVSRPTASRRHGHRDPMRAASRENGS